MSARSLDAAGTGADAVWGEAEPGSQLETLAAALRDAVTAVRPLLDTIASLREQMETLREQVARVEEIAHDH